MLGVSVVGRGGSIYSNRTLCYYSDVMRFVLIMRLAVVSLATLFAFGFADGSDAYALNLLTNPGFPSFRGNNANTGASPYTVQQPTRVSWSISVDGEFYAPPSMAPDGTIYVGGTDDVLYALRPNGSVVFTRRITRSSFFIPFSTPVVAPNGYIYIGCREWTLRNFSPEGKPSMVYHVDDSVRTGPLIDADNNLYFGTGLSFYSYGAKGNLRWIRKFDRLIYPLAAMTSDGRVAFTDGRHRLYCLRSSDGETVWDFDAEGFISDYPLVMPDDRIVITCHSAGKNLLYILTTEGKIDNALYLPDWLPYTPLLGHDGTMYVASFSGYVYAITSAGESLWKFKVPLSFPPAMTVDATGTLLVGGLDGYLYAISEKGEFLWKFDIGSPIHAAPLIGQEGQIYICTVDGIMYTLS